MSDPQPAPPAAAQAVADAGRIEAAAAVLERRYPAARPEMLDLTISELHSIARVWRRMAGQPAAAAVEPAAPLVAAALDREAAADIDRDPMWHRAYMDVQKVLDEALGTEEEDGSGSGIAGDVWLLAHQRDAAREQAEAAEGKLAAMRGLCSEPLRARGFRPGTTGVIEENYLRVEDILAITGTEGDGPFTPDTGHPSAADCAMVARATGGGIRSREVQPEFGTEGDEGRG